jgi:hypothetical protein
MTIGSAIENSIVLDGPSNSVKYKFPISKCSTKQYVIFFLSNYQVDISCYLMKATTSPLL